MVSRTMGSKLLVFERAFHPSLDRRKCGRHCADSSYLRWGWPVHCIGCHVAAR
jgi:hypothetical protein